MREIKFRAWDDKRKKMVRAKLFQNESLNFVDERGFLLMQYIGICASNADCVYEGDILRFHDDGSVHEVIYGAELYNSPDYMLEPGRSDSDLSDIYCYSIAEVIGNVYENPELLEAKK